MLDTPGMTIELVPIDALHLDPANVRQRTERSLAAIKASLARFGQQKPLVVDANNIVRAGNGTLEAARALGWGEIAITRTALKGSEATAYAVADNRSAELSEWEPIGLAETLRALQSEDFDMEAVGWTEEEIDGLIGQLGDNLLTEDPAPPEDFTEHDENIETEHTCPKCGYQWSGGT